MSFIFQTLFEGAAPSYKLFVDISLLTNHNFQTAFCDTKFPRLYLKVNNPEKQPA